MGVLVIMKVTARRACVVSVEGEDNNRHNSIHLKSATSLRRTKTKKKGRSSTSPASGSRTRPVIRKSSKGAILHLRRVLRRPFHADEEQGNITTCLPARKSER